jgi:hypothetical protein
VIGSTVFKEAFGERGEIYNRPDKNDFSHTVIKGTLGKIFLKYSLGTEEPLKEKLSRKKWSAKVLYDKLKNREVVIGGLSERSLV